MEKTLNDTDGWKQSRPCLHGRLPAICIDKCSADTQVLPAWLHAEIVHMPWLIPLLLLRDSPRLLKNNARLPSLQHKPFHLIYSSVISSRNLLKLLVCIKPRKSIQN